MLKQLCAPAATEPNWEHEVVFGSDAVAQGGGVVTLEVWDDKVLADQVRVSAGTLQHPATLYALLHEMHAL